LNGQEYFQWRWSHEPILQNPDASGLHCLGSAFLAGSFDNSMKWYESDLITLGLGIGWEIKDGIIDYRYFGILGGEGFSWNDVKMDLSGILFHRIGVLVYNRIKYKVWNLNKIERRIR